jgi:uncharacterized protein (TIGR02099 family)
VHHWLRKTAILFWYLIASLVILAAIIGVALQALTPVINNHKADIEYYLSHLLKENVHIDSVQANWARFGPEIHFKGLSLSEKTTDGQVKPLIRVDDLSIQLGMLETLWHRALYFSALSVSGSAISIRETAADHYLINNAFSIDLSNQSPSQAPEFFAWLVSQNTIRLSQLQLDFFQLNGTAISVQFDHANVYQSDKGNGRKRLAFSIEGSLLEKILKVGQDFKKLQADVTLYAWLDLYQQKPTLLELELLSENIILQNNKTTRVYPSLEGVFLWQPVGERWLLQGKNVTLINASQQSEDYSFELWRFPHYYAAHLNFVNVTDVLNVADFLDIAPQNFNMQTAKLGGVIEDIDLQLPDDFSATDQYRFSAIFHDVSSAAYQELPELHHLAGAISGGLTQGKFTLLDNNDDIYFSHYFNQAISVKNLAVNGQWSHTVDQLSLLLNSINVMTPLATAQGAMQLDIPLTSAAPTMLSLLAEYHLTQSQAVITLLPMKEFDPDFATWLTDAVGNGAGSDGKVLIRGSIDAFPYPEQQGVFMVDGFIKPLTVSFSPEWSSVDNVAGHLLLHNQALDLSVTGSSLGVGIVAAHVTAPDYAADHAVVNVEVTATAQARDYLHYIDNSPLASTLGQWLSPFTLTGKGVLSLHLGLPLGQLDAEHIQVSGQWLAEDASFMWKALNMGVNNIKGAIHFTQNSIYADHVDARLLNEPAQISISTEQKKDAMTAINIDAQGNFTPAQLQTIFKIDDLCSFLSGRSSYHAHLRVPMMAPEYSVSVDSHLLGMAIKLPQPLGKHAKVSTPFSVQATINPTADSMNFLVHYTKNMDASIAVQDYSQTNPRQKNIQIDAHAIAFSWPLNVTIPKSSASSGAWWQSLSSLTLRFNHFSLYDNDFSSVVLSATQNNNGFIWKIHANEAQGNITLPSDTKSPITASFDYLTLASSKGMSGAKAIVSAQDAASWPEIVLKIQRFKLAKQTLGEVILHTSPLKNGIAFNDVQVKNAIYQLGARGQWVNANKQDTTALQGAFSTNNVGEFFQETDITKNFEAKKGSVEYNIQWPGSPMNFQFKSLAGDSTIKVNDGVIPLSGDAAKMGLGKVLSLFSTQSIQRRLQLNFSDLNQNGYSFNSLVSELHFQSGNAEVKQGEFDGPSAKIAFSGRVGLAQQDYDLRLVVTPYVTSTIPLIATLAGGPIAGVAAYAFDKIAEGSIAKFTAYHYLLVGPWSQPTLIDLDEQAKQKAAAKQAQLDVRNVAPVSDLVG